MDGSPCSLLQLGHFTLHQYILVDINRICALIIEFNNKQTYVTVNFIFKHILVFITC